MFGHFPSRSVLKVLKITFAKIIHKIKFSEEHTQTIKSNASKATVLNNETIFEWIQKLSNIWKQSYSLDFTWRTKSKQNLKSVIFDSKKGLQTVLGPVEQILSSFQKALKVTKQWYLLETVQKYISKIS